MFYRFLFVLIISFNAWGQYSYIDYPSPYHPTLSQRGMVVSQNIDSSKIGIEILNKGGNAIDAAVAVGFSLAVTLPRAGNLGGAGFMLVYLKEKDEIYAVDYLGSSPKHANTKNLFGVELPKGYKKADRDLVRYGYKASTIPGTVAGLIEAHSNFGRLPLKEVIQPAIEQAKNGIKVSYDLHMALTDSSQLKNDPESRKIFFEGNSAIKENTILKRPDLAQTLEKIAEQGAKGFYQGETAKKIVDAMKKNKGYISLEDLQNYKPRFSDPILTVYRGNRIYAPRPSSGGAIVVLDALNILENFYGISYVENRKVEENGKRYRDRAKMYDIEINDIIKILTNSNKNFQNKHLSFLDIGCGDGSFLKLTKMNFENTSLYGSEFTHHVYKYLRK